MTKLAKVSLAVIALGLFSFALIFVYYHFHLGIKPCKGLPSDANNCGDADFGGVYFILAGVPLVIVGTAGLITAGIKRYTAHRKSAHS